MRLLPPTAGREAVAQVLRGIELVGRKALRPREMGEEARYLDSLSDVRLMARTVLPAWWFTDALPWSIVLSRYWRTDMDITIGEMRAVRIWIQTLCSLGCMHH